MQDSIEKKVLAALLTKDVYYKVGVNKELFSDKLHKLLMLLEELHSKYESDIDLDVLISYYTDTSRESETRKEYVITVLNELRGTHLPDIDQIIDMVKSMSDAEDKRKLIALAFDSSSTKEDLMDMVLGWSSTTATRDTGLVSPDMDCILEVTDTKHRIPFALQSLQEETTGIDRGAHVAVFARTNVGKSTFMTHNTAHWIGEGYKVVYFANEDSGNKLMLRIAQGLFNYTVDQVRKYKHTQEFQDKWKEASSNLKLIYNPSLDISDISAYVSRHKPDVCVIDQLDNVSFKKVRSKDVNHLGLLWQEARRIGGMNDTVIFSVTQASADAAGKLYLTETMCADSKTDKAAALDMLLGIGTSNNEDDRRCINIIKNKINDRHVPVFGSIDSARARFVI